MLGDAAQIAPYICLSRVPTFALADSEENVMNKVVDLLVQATDALNVLVDERSKL